MHIQARLPALAAVVALLPAACAFDPIAPATDRIDLAPHLQGTRATGVSLDPVSQNLHVVVQGRGLLELSTAGALVATRATGQAGLEPRPFKDVGALGDGRFVLLADNEGYLWDELTERFDVHFCVLPGFELEQIAQKNDAVVVGAEVIVAAPRFYQVDMESGEETLLSSELRTYQTSTGEPLSSAPLIEGHELKGLALDGAEVLGAAGSLLHRFDQAGALVSQVQLADVEDAQGLARAGQRVWVLDAAGEALVAFAAADLR
jgi:hypothetical protein